MDRPSKKASVAVSLSDHSEMSALLSTIRGGVGEVADSVRVSFTGSKSALLSTINGDIGEVADSVRVSFSGSKSVVVNLLERFGDSVRDVSASATISLRGDRPA